MPDPQSRLTPALFELYATIRRRHPSYNPSTLRSEIDELGGHGAAGNLVDRPQPSKGFIRLIGLHTPELTVEALILKPEWCGLFEPRVLQICRDRLQNVGFEFPPENWPAAVALPPPPTPVALDSFLSPPRIPTVTYRVLRDTEIARRVKQLHGYKCQVCGNAIQLPDGTLYAEAHHIQPLGGEHEGPDVEKNLLCLCPNHHVEFDYGVRPIDLGSLTSVSAHSIGTSYCDYHNNVIFRRGGAIFIL